MAKISSKVKVALKKLLSISLGEVTTDKATLIFDGEGEIAVGTEVFIKDENDEVIAAPDGDYTVEDGKVIKVAEGKVAEIVEVEKPVDEPELSEAEQKFNAQKVEMSASYDEIRRNIQQAVNACGINGWIVEAAADYAIVDVWTGEKDIYYRYELTTNEDGTVVLGGAVEVKPAFVPVEEPKAEPVVEEPVAVAAAAVDPLEPAAEDANKPEDNEDVIPSVDERIAALEELVGNLKDSIDSILNGNAALESRLAEVETKVAKVETEPAAEPAANPTVEEESQKSKMSYLRKN